MGQAVPSLLCCDRIFRSGASYGLSPDGFSLRAVLLSEQPATWAVHGCSYISSQIRARRQQRIRAFTRLETGQPDCKEMRFSDGLRHGASPQDRWTKELILRGASSFHGIERQDIHGAGLWQCIRAWAFCNLQAYQSPRRPGRRSSESLPCESAVCTLCDIQVRSYG